MARLYSMRAALIGASLLVATGTANAATESVLLDFPKAKKTGGNPPAGVAVDASGNLYTTALKGTSGYVFKLSPPSQGGTEWQETILYTLPANAGRPDGGVIFDAAGNLYGTSAGSNGSGGMVYELTPPAGKSKKWTGTTLYTFTNTNGDGSVPVAAVAFDGAGNLYGTTVEGGASGQGTVYQLTPPLPGQTRWTESVLWSFTGGADGARSMSTIAVDPAGNLYGTASEGGNSGSNCFLGNTCGTVFELTPPKQHTRTAPWGLTVLWAFTGESDGANPMSGVVFDNAGNLYGDTYDGSPGGTDFVQGTVYELSPPAPGQTAWTETTLQPFNTCECGGGANALSFGPDGSLYTTMYAGPGKKGVGAVVKFSPPTGGQTQWPATILHAFTGVKTGDAANPTAGVAFDAAGNLYGTTFYGGAGKNDGYGAVYEVTP